MIFQQIFCISYEGNDNLSFAMKLNNKTKLSCFLNLIISYFFLDYIRINFFNLHLDISWKLDQYCWLLKYWISGTIPCIALGAQIPTPLIFDFSFFSDSNPSFLHFYSFSCQLTILLSYSNIFLCLSWVMLSFLKVISALKG